MAKAEFRGEMGDAYEIIMNDESSFPESYFAFITLQNQKKYQRNGCQHKNEE